MGHCKAAMKLKSARKLYRSAEVAGRLQLLSIFISDLHQRTSTCNYEFRGEGTMYPPKTNKKLIVAAMAMLSAPWLTLCAGQQPAANDSDAAKADNTRVNKRDRNKEEVTADQQKMNGSDRELARKIRRSLMDDKSLSTYAHNVKIIARNGTVTLKGPVRSEDEKTSIESKANEVAGSGNVKSELSIAPKKDK
jgi:hyperosmotically inducible protein